MSSLISRSSIRTDISRTLFRSGTHTISIAKRSAPFYNNTPQPKRQSTPRPPRSIAIMAEPLNLTYKPDDVSYDDAAAFEIVKTLLNASSDSSVTVETTAKDLAATLPGPPGSDGTDAHYTLYNMVIDVAKQIPHNHPALVRLVRTVEALSLSPKTVFTETTNGFETSRRLHTFGWNLRDVFGPPFEPNRPPTDGQLASYLSIQAFTALLWSRGLIHGDDFVLWQLRSAFEEDVEDAKEAAYLSAAAGLWIVHAGSRVWQLVTDGPVLSGPDARSLRAGEKLGGEGGYGKERWAFWVKGFDARAEGGDGVDAGIAKRAAAVMKGIAGDL
ncbi:hypothetical protein HYQ44_019897 [Verticillium longisporum]|nr:hypothetical protein HYQ44_019897 [Verticillium longisporum]